MRYKLMRALQQRGFFSYCVRYYSAAGGGNNAALFLTARVTLLLRRALVSSLRLRLHRAGPHRLLRHHLCHQRRCRRRLPPCQERVQGELVARFGLNCAAADKCCAKVTFVLGENDMQGRNSELALFIDCREGRERERERERERV
jgi:hypothetical protein